MKFFVVALLVVITFAQSAVSSDEWYSTDYKVDIDEILKSDRLLKNYIDCILDKGNCTPEGNDLKKAIPDALQNECAKCNEKHKDGIKKVLKHLIKEKPEAWKEIVAKYDPKGEYKVQYSKYLEQEGLTI